MLREMLKRLAAGDRADPPRPEVLASFLSAGDESSDEDKAPTEAPRVLPRRPDRAREIAMNRVRRLRIHAA